MESKIFTLQDKALSIKAVCITRCRGSGRVSISKKKRTKHLSSLSDTMDNNWISCENSMLVMDMEGRVGHQRLRCF
jgi:hypothetical protein